MLPKKGISDIEKYTPEYLLEKMQVTPEQITDLKGLMGDSSDNIPGVPGVGEKTATKLLTQFNSLEQVYEHLDEVKGKKLKENLTTYHDDAVMSKELATINRDSPVAVGLEDVIYEGYSTGSVRNIFMDLGFQSLLTRLSDSEETEEEAVEHKEIKYDIVNDVTEEIFSDEDVIVVEMLGENYHTAQIEGIGIVNDNKKKLYSYLCCNGIFCF